MPLQAREPVPLADGSATREGASLHPDVLSVQQLVDAVGEPGSEATDVIPGVAPFDFCWTEAIAGCPIVWRADQVWAEPCLDDLHDLSRLQTASESPWLTLLGEWTRLLAKRAEGRYPASPPLLRGPIDIAAAAVGDERLCWAMIDEPDTFRQLLAACTDVFLVSAQTWSAAKPLFHGGSCIYDVWAPGTTIRTQADNAALLSPRLYREFLLPCDERICAAFDYPLIHTHSAVLHIMVDAIVDLPALRGVQVSLDYPGGPSLVDLLPLLRQLNECKPLVITGPVTQEELDTLLASLSPRGLCLEVKLREDGTGHAEPGAGGRHLSPARAGGRGY
ncbi:MAG: hypothetical protein CL878_03485 [Dehalococcoidia bacterium]|nr:hypothetical protein [Dehalococcoidia bacterium]